MSFLGKIFGFDKCKKCCDHGEDCDCCKEKKDCCQKGAPMEAPVEQPTQETPENPQM